MTKDLEDALALYEKALSIDNAEAMPFIHANIGNIYYDKGDYDRALSEYLLANSLADCNKLKADTLYNIGNTFFRNQDYERAAQSYIEALKLNPEDRDSRHNFELSLRALEEEPPAEEEQQDEEEDRDDESEDQEDAESPPEDGDEDEQDQEEQDSSPESDQDEQEISLDMQEIDRLLDMMQDEDRQIQEERIQSAVEKAIPEGMGDVEKDW